MTTSALTIPHALAPACLALSVVALACSPAAGFDTARRASIADDPIAREPEIAGRVGRAAATTSTCSTT